MMAAMDEKEDRSQALEATLQEKESQLEQLTELQKVCLRAIWARPCINSHRRAWGIVRVLSWLKEHGMAKPLLAACSSWAARCSIGMRAACALSGIVPYISSRLACQQCPLSIRP